MKLLNIAGVAALAAGMALGQSAPAHAGRRAGQGAMMQRLAADLNLTDAQKQQARAIFSTSRQAAPTARRKQPLLIYSSPRVEVLRMRPVASIRYCRLFSILPLAIGLVLPASAQESRASIVGRAVDSSNAVVVGTKISAKNLQTGVAASATTNASGAFLIPFLLPCKYPIP